MMETLSFIPEQEDLDDGPRSIPEEPDDFLYRESDQIYAFLEKLGNE